MYCEKFVGPLELWFGQVLTLESKTQELSLETSVGKLTLAWTKKTIRWTEYVTSTIYPIWKDLVTTKSQNLHLPLMDPYTFINYGPRITVAIIRLTGLHPGLVFKKFFRGFNSHCISVPPLGVYVSAEYGNLP